MESSEIKEQLLMQMQKVLDQKQQVLQQDIQALRLAMENETKSSAGDKFETGREMMQAELSKAENQVRMLAQQLVQLNRVDVVSKNSSVCFGSLVQTDAGNYFIALPLGKFNVDGKQWITLSLASPLGTVLQGKKGGNEFLFQRKKIQVIEFV